MSVPCSSLTIHSTSHHHITTASTKSVTFFTPPHHQFYLLNLSPKDKVSSSSTMTKPESTPNTQDPRAEKAARALRARQIGRGNTEKQNAARAALPLGGLYILLFLRDGDNPQTNDFHWGYYLHESSAGGMKYHIKGKTNHWNAGHEATGGVYESMLLCVVVKVGQIPASEYDQIDQIMKTYDGALNNFPGISCRVWIWMIMEKLIDGEMVQNSGTVAELEQECFAFGNQHISDTVANEQPRPLVRSSLCR